MTKEMWFEVIGYTGSLLVLVSMLMTSVVKLRIINLIGSAVFTVYALLIHSYPTAFLNACLVIINVVQLIRQQRTKGGSYELETLRPGEGFTGWFLQKHGDDMKKYFPGIDTEALRNAEGFSVFFDDQAAGVLLGNRKEDCFEILLDYTTPAFRDCSVGTFLYGKLADFGIAKLTCVSDSPEHVKYMEKVGFVRDADGLFVKELK